MKIIFDTDTSIDDALALLYLQACNDLDLLCITTGTGNANVEQCTRNARSLRDMLGIDVPVYRGSETTYKGDVSEQYPESVYGENGLGDVPIPLPPSDPDYGSAVSALSHHAHKYPGEVTLVAGGRLTNVALAMLKDPFFARQLKQIVIMGGTWQHPGNVTEWAEFNILGDPEAADEVFRSGVPLTMVGLDVTSQTRMSPDFLNPITVQLNRFAPGLGDFFTDISSVYASYHLKTHGQQGFPVQDASAIAFAAHPELFTTVTGQLESVLKGDDRGRTLFSETVDGPHRVCVAVASEKLLEDYAASVISYYQDGLGPNIKS